MSNNKQIMKKIAMYDLEGHLLEVFEVETYRELETTLNIPQGSLNSCLKQQQLATTNRQFVEIASRRRILNKIGDISNLTTDHLKPVHKFYKNKYICSYSSIKEASRKNNIDASGILRACSPIIKTSGGFCWRYANASENAEDWKQTKAMHKEEQSKFTIDYFNWLHNNQYKYNPKVKMYQKMMINETLFFTIEELMIEFNKIQGGNKEQT